MAGPIRATELMFDDAELARRARTTLAGAERGTLMVATGSAARLRECEVQVRDDGGEPVVGSPCPIVLAPNRTHAALLLWPNEQYGVGLTLIGRIAPAGQSPGGGASFALSVERVLASCPKPSFTSSRMQIPLALYAGAEPDAIAANGWRIARHLTEAHQPQVRSLAAGLTGQPVDEVIAAQVSRLGCDRLQLWWVGSAGASVREVAFDRPAGDLADLGRLVRNLLGPCG
ncbi:MAG: hypothetical protein ACR2N4_17020 [Jatrophihabitans sp.]